MRSARKQGAFPPASDLRSLLGEIWGVLPLLREVESHSSFSSTNSR